MSLVQPSLWDNMDLQQGYTSLSELRLKEAMQYFLTAPARTLAEEAEIKTAVEAIEYWQPVLSSQNSLSTSKYLDAFLLFHFPASLRLLKKALLKRSVDLIGGDKLSEEWESLFDLLLANSEYEVALTLLDRIKKMEPQNNALFYFYGQAYHRKKVLGLSKTFYGKALLLHPTVRFLQRVESETIQNLVSSKGVSMAYLYGHLRDIFETVSIPESVSPLDEQHQKTLSLNNLYTAAKDTSRTDRSVQISLRRQMKEIDPEFLAEFLRAQS